MANRLGDWRIWVGSIISALWIGLGLAYVFGVVGWEGFFGQGMDVLGSFLEGAFAPLAFLWLVIGLFIQQNQLARNTDELRRTNEQSIKQTEAIAATERNARQEAFFKISENVQKQLNSIAGMILISNKGQVGDGTYSEAELAEFWRQHTSGDHEFFARKLLNSALGDEAVLQDLFFGTAIRQKHTENYLKNFRRLLRLAKDCDVEDTITDSIKDTAHGLLFKYLRQHRPSEPLSDDRALN